MRRTSAVLTTALGLGVAATLAPPAAVAAPRCMGERATIVGTSGDDVLEGGPGRDSLDGGEGADRCIDRGETTVRVDCERPREQAAAAARQTGATRAAYGTVQQGGDARLAALLTVPGRSGR